jgi:hypothetical protein
MIFLKSRFFLAVIFVFSLFGKSSAQAILFETFPKTYVAYRAASPILLDGKLDESCWQHAPWTDEFQDIEGPSMPAPLFSTKVKMLWDDKYFYIAAKLEEPHLWATLTERESVIFHDNNFEVFIDPSGDTHNYYELEINAFGTIWDLLLTKPYRNGGMPLSAWDVAGFEYGIQLHGTLNDPSDVDSHWVIEMAFPWKVLKETAPYRRPPLPGEQWRINFSRVQWQLDVVDGQYQKRINPESGQAFAENNWVWSPQYVIDMHRPEFWGYVQFSGNISGNQTEEFYFKPEENVKFALRELYYLQHQYFWKNHSYAKSFDELEPNKPELFTHITFDFDVARTRFRLSASDPDGKSTWHISEDGRIWKTQSPIQERGMFY